LKVCAAYTSGGKTIDEMPANQTILHHAEPVYEEVKGWEEDLTGVTEFDELPTTAQEYIRRLEELVGVPIKVVSVGPSREQSLTVP
jgi:adenylosuccinate synthase